MPKHMLLKKLQLFHPHCHQLGKLHFSPQIKTSYLGLQAVCHVFINWLKSLEGAMYRFKTINLGNIIPLCYLISNNLNPQEHNN
jgi:hypothetical protein